MPTEVLRRKFYPCFERREIEIDWKEISLWVHSAWLNHGWFTHGGEINGLLLLLLLLPCLVTNDLTWFNLYFVKYNRIGKMHFLSLENFSCVIFKQEKDFSAQLFYFSAQNFSGFMAHNLYMAKIHHYIRLIEDCQDCLQGK